MRTLLPCLIVAALTLVAATAAQATPGAVLVTRAEGAPLRADAGPTATLLRRLERGQRLLEFRRRGVWVEVAVFGLVGVRGWLRSDDLVAEQASPATPAAPPPLAGPAEEAAVASFVLDIAGTPALAFRASCRVVAAAGTQHTTEVAGLVPQRFAMEAEAVSCRVQKRDVSGRLRVSLSGGTTLLAAAETRAAFNWVRVRSDGPWGVAGGLRGSVGLVLPRTPEPPPQGPLIDSLPRRPLPRAKAPRRRRLLVVDVVPVDVQQGRGIDQAALSEEIGGRRRRRAVDRIDLQRPRLAEPVPVRHVQVRRGGQPALDRRSVKPLGCALALHEGADSRHQR